MNAPLVCSLLVFAAAAPQTSVLAFDHSHQAYDQLLRQHVDARGWVNYEAIGENPAELRGYLDSLAKVTRAEFDAWTEPQQLAFLFNLYNADTLELIADHLPVETILEIGPVFGQPWEIPCVELFGQTVTLNHLEHEVLRGNFVEPRLHFALVCAAAGCPPLRNEAYVAEKLDAQLDEQARAFLASESKNRIDAATKTVYLSKIFDWYEEDFASSSQSLIDYAKPYFPPDAAAGLTNDFTIEFTDYDWKLNAQGATPDAAPHPDGAAGWILAQLQKIRNMGALGAILFVLIYIAATVAFVPGSLLTIGAGVLYGPILGTVLVSIASVIGASLAFLLGRYIMRKPIEGKVRGNEKFGAIDDAVGKEGWKIVLLTRLSPVFPFNLQNYAYGLTKVKFAHYVLASWIGMLPGTILYVYLGSAAGNLAEFAAGSREKTSAEVVLFWVGLALTLVVAVYVTKLAKNALKNRVDSDAAA